jgi:outer membrane protein OmpA-like peptidoglycan-associated protein
MKTLKYVVVMSTVVVFAIFAGCAPKHTVILVPDPDGHVGKASIMTEAGQQHLEKPGDMTRVTTKSSAPSAVKTADNTFISMTFADAFAAEPIPPEKFILYFKTGKTELTAESEAALPNILASIKKRGAINITVSGHTDTVGSDQFNETLSRNRAESIHDLLIRGGVPGDLITVTSHGKGNPLIPVPDGVAEPRNRRVEVTVH